ncbi:MAG: hypothetical protein AB7P31_05515 [Steroidobacteraceae bacterium]
MIEWLVTLLFGTGATFAPTPVDLPSGETFLLAPKPLKPVSDGMCVNIGIGASTADTKSTVLSGSLKISEYGDLKVFVCKSKEDCLAINSTGTFFSEKSYGFAFSGAGPAFKGSRFVGVRITSTKALSKVVVSWSNFIQ